MKLYEFSASRSIRCVWTLNELAMAAERVEVDLSKGEHKTPAFRAHNPLEAVPVIDDDGFVLTESSAICTYLADKKPEAGLVPSPRTRERARYDQWLAFCLTSLDAPLWVIRRHVATYPPQERVAAVVPVAAREFRRAAAHLERHLASNAFVLGDAFSVADIVVGHTLMWGAWFPREAATGVMEGFPTLHEYIRRLADRPACPSELSEARR